MSEAPRTPPHETPLPLSVITGFLGSGKTTLLSRLLSDPRMANAAVIINEFGEVGLDHFLVTKPKEDVVLLSSGCLCCSVRGDLVNTLATLYLERARGEIPAFDRVLVETTGLAEPAPVLLTVTADPELSRVFRLEKVLTTVDAAHGAGQIDRHPESVKQVCVADSLLITKTDIADPAASAGLHSRLRHLNPVAEMVDVVHGEIDPDRLFDFSAERGVRSAADLQRWLTTVAEGEAAGDLPELHEDGHHHVHPAHDGIRSFAAVLEETVTPAGLELWMNLLSGFRGPNLLRVKGLLNVEGRPVVVQAVQHMFHPPSELPDWPSDDHRSRLVFITRGIERDEIEKTLGALTFELPKKDGKSSIDPEAFRRFAEAALTFR